MDSIKNYPVNNAELKEILRNYFSSAEVEKPIVILSKPFSGRSETVKQIIKEQGIDERDCLNYSTYHCPLLHNDSIVEENSSPMSFDQWLETYLDKRRVNYKQYKFCIIEIEPNEFLDIDNISLWGNDEFGHSGLGQGYLRALKSDKFQLVAYYPKVEEWIEWAKANNFNQNTIDFAVANPELYYLISYRVFLDFENALRYFDCFDIKMYIPCINIWWPYQQILFKACVKFLSEKGIPYKI